MNVYRTVSYMDLKIIVINLENNLLPFCELFLVQFRDYTLAFSLQKCVFITATFPENLKIIVENLGPIVENISDEITKLSYFLSHVLFASTTKLSSLISEAIENYIVNCWQNSQTCFFRKLICIQAAFPENLSILYLRRNLCNVMEIKN